MNSQNKITTDEIKNIHFSIKDKNLYEVTEITADDEEYSTPFAINDFLLGKTYKKSQSEIKNLKPSNTLLRLFIKNGEYVYARPNDIIIIESCDHLVKVYLAFGDTIKKTIRHNTLKDFLLLLPQDHFVRIGRFCAVNMHRLSGGNCKNQTFEFDFKVSVKLKHTLSQSAFKNIGK